LLIFAAVSIMCI